MSPVSRLFVAFLLVLAGYTAFFLRNLNLEEKSAEVISRVNAQATSSAQIEATSSTQNQSSQSQPVSRFKNDEKTPIPVSTVKPVKNGLRVPILTYHYVGNNPNPNDKARDYLSVTPDRFEEQMDWISKNRTTITLDELYNALNSGSTLPQNPIILTFDDGYIDFYYNAWPILQKFNLKAVSYIPTGLVGQPAYMTWEMIQKVHSAGLVDFQSHGVNHRKLTSLSQSELEFEIFESKKELEIRLNKKINHFCYPYGSFDNRVIKVISQAGYLTSTSTVNGIYQVNQYGLTRVKMDNSYTSNILVSKF
ncbi:MAG TPA: polysaccharide deacetylase family protein [Patescibacteria group bacterium]